ncbi:pentapeptide repeat-containing protein [Halorussus caseinilyticus]|uniref:Pentapeptide repeat-containing protein n=1 Tax=Halorussus caseinilyticus TaxID=3034025 RepID=A0ABD5WEN7_9EURY
MEPDGTVYLARRRGTPGGRPVPEPQVEGTGSGGSCRPRRILGRVESRFRVRHARDFVRRLFAPRRKSEEGSFPRSNFSGANLRWADLTRGDFAGADFRDADLRDATLDRAAFELADLREANLRSGDLEDANFRDADLRGANLRGIDAPDARLKEANLADANLEDAKLADADLRDADLEDANLRKAKLGGANLEDASLVRTDLRETTLEDARLYQTYFSDVRIDSDTEFGDSCVYEDLDELDDWDATPTEAAVWTYRRLQDLHEKYALTERARHYHVKKKESQKRHNREEGNYLQYAIHAVNGVASEHGESPWRVVGVSTVVIAIWSVLYLLLGKIRVPTDTSGTDAIGLGLFPSLSLPSPVAEIATSVYFSVVTFTTLGYGDLQPATGFAQALATVESFLGALLMAYLVFVLGRRTNW